MILKTAMSQKNAQKTKFCPTWFSLREREKRSFTLKRVAWWQKNAAFWSNFFFSDRFFGGSSLSSVSNWVSGTTSDLFEWSCYKQIVVRVLIVQKKSSYLDAHENDYFAHRRRIKLELLFPFVNNLTKYIEWSHVLKVHLFMKCFLAFVLNLTPKEVRNPYKFTLS